jgi:rhodanese-related sulfurtransferase
MERKYTILSILLIVLALGLVILPKKNDRKEIDPNALLSSIVEKSRYLTVDQVTHRIIENDPSLTLIDLRSADQYKAFTLPGAINMHPDSLFNRSGYDLLNQTGKDKILFASSDLLSEKAWLLCSRYSATRVYIMKGGMNEWFNTFIKIKPISGTPSSTDLDLLSFRNAARQFFVGSGETNIVKDAPKEKEKIPIIRKAPKAASGGGC